MDHLGVGIEARVVFRGGANPESVEAQSVLGHPLPPARLFTIFTMLIIGESIMYACMWTMAGGRTGKKNRVKDTSRGDTKSLFVGFLPSFKMHFVSQCWVRRGEG